MLQYHGAVNWEPALWLAGGSAAGSFTAARWSVSRGHGAIRRVVVLIAILALARELWMIAGLD